MLHTLYGYLREMAVVCSEGHYWDRLVNQCLSCQMMCNKPDCPVRCMDFCVVYDCKAVAGQFYDRLLKKCWKCSELCGHHPSECSQECSPHLSKSVTTRPGGVSTLQPLNTRWSHEPKEMPYTDVLAYSLLGLCVIMLLSTVIVTLMLLLKRARGQKECGEKKAQQPNGHRQSSKDCLMAEAVTQEVNGVVSERPRATETCVHCFSEQAGTPQSLYQQAIPQYLNGDPQHCHHYTNGLGHGHLSRND